ncbi:hypothetical protein PINS_up003333 [Pythium insidiosum]|nr:hypothetical protein PINS_up003333 [Pythium insidiosum]
MLGRSSSVITYDASKAAATAAASDAAEPAQNADVRRGSGSQHPAKLTRTKSLPASQRHLIQDDEATGKDDKGDASTKEGVAKSRYVPSIIAALRPSASGMRDGVEGGASQAKKLAQQEQAEHYEAIMKRFQLRK